MQTNGTALILGATGGIGGEVARRMLSRGWTVRALHRNPDSLTEHQPGLDWRRGDALRADSVVAAAEGTDVILHAVNPPGYRRWAELVLPMIDASVAAARATGARLVLPGTIYNFGPDAWPLLTEDAPQNPVTEKGRIRVALEDRMRRLADDGGRALILRAGDFFGPRTGNSWFAQGMVKPGRAVRSITLPGRPGIGHQWAYVPDMAETMLALLDRGADLPSFARFHFAGHWDADGMGMADAIRRVTGTPGLPVKRLNWPLVRVAGMVMPTLREIAGMRYLWEQPLRMPGDKLSAFLGAVPHTKLDRAVADTLTGLGCVDQGLSAGGRHLLSGGGRSPA